VTSGYASLIIGIRTRSVKRGLQLLTTQVAVALGIPYELASLLVSENIHIGIQTEFHARPGWLRVSRIADVIYEKPDRGPELRDLYTIDRSKDAPTQYKLTTAESRTGLKRAL
jgi:hypothetical protein